MFEISWRASPESHTALKTVQHKSFPDFCHFLENSHEKDQKVKKIDVRFFIRGEMGDTRKGNKNLKEAKLLILDCDKTNITPNQAHERLNIKHYIYTSVSHTEKINKYRIVVPFKHQQEECERATIYLASLIPGLVIDPASWRWIQEWYVSKEGCWSEYHDGTDLVVPDDFVIPTEEEIESATEKARTANTKSNSSYEDCLKDLMAGKEAHPNYYKMAQALLARGMNVKSAFATLQPLVKISFDINNRDYEEFRDDRIMKAIEDGWEKDHAKTQLPNTTFIPKNEYNYTKLPIPTGGLKLIYEYALSKMRYPNPEIAISVAEHAVSVFGGGHYHIQGNTTTRKRIVLAPQGTGKSTIGVVMTNIVNTMCDMTTNGNNLGLAGTVDYIGNDSFSFSIQQQQIQKHRVRSFVINEAGAAGSSKSGDIGTMRAYQLDVLSKKVSDSYMPKQYSSAGANKNIKMEEVYGCVWVYYHESTINSYVDLLNKTGSFENGDLSRSDLFFINPVINKAEINVNHYDAELTVPQFNLLKNLIIDFVSLEKKAGNDPTNRLVWKEIDVSLIENLLTKLEADIVSDRNAAVYNRNDVELSLLVRKYEKVCNTILISALADAAMNKDMEKPVATVDHFNYALKREVSMSNTILSHITNGGALGRNVDGIVNDVISSIKNGGMTAQRLKCRWNEEYDCYEIPRSLIRTLLNTTSMSRYIETTFRGDQTRATQTIIRDMMEMDYIANLEGSKNRLLVNQNIVSKDEFKDPTFFGKTKRGRRSS